MESIAVMEWLRTAVESAGGPSKVGRAAGLSDEHICNLMAGRRPLTPRVAALLREVLTGVPSAQWVEATMGVAFTQKEPRRTRRQVKTAVAS